MQRLICDMVVHVREFNKFRTNQIIVSSSYSRPRLSSGLLAYLLPLKFRGGSPIECRTQGRKVYHWARIPFFHEGYEVLYLIYFLMPRFFNLSYSDKLETIVHELYHIHPDFNGDLRRFKGRSKIHGSYQEYETKVKELTKEYLKSSSSLESTDFLRRRFFWASRFWGGIEATHFPEPKPKLLKVADIENELDPRPPRLRMEPELDYLSGTALE